jgi:hypothetical protein
LGRGLGQRKQLAVLGHRKRRRIDMQAYCMKCRAKKEMAEPVQITMKNGKPATQGKCSVCGTKLFRIGK